MLKQRNESWGNYRVVGQGKNFWVKILTFKCRESNSGVQKYKDREVFWYVLKGSFTLQKGKNSGIYYRGESVMIKRDTKHQAIAHSPDSKIIEFVKYDT